MIYNCLLPSFSKIIPPLTNQLHKGSNGRIGVIGGSMEYTGAPYFAAISALKVGADLVHVFCSKAAAPVIKSYSPELIVHPLLDAPDAVNDINQWISRLHALVIGPGLGRDPSILETVLDVVKNCPPIPIVVDADGINLLIQYPDIFNTKKHLYITPNAVEFKRLTDNSVTLPHAMYIIKGEHDIIKGGGKEYKCDERGSARRCGGQGDVLSGVLGTFAAWTAKNVGSPSAADSCCAAVAASALTRRCSYLAFQKYKRSMMASNLIEFIPEAFENIFECE